MKSLYALVVFLFCCGGIAHAQVGIGTTTPNPNSVLELVSPGNDQGLLTPRMTTAQRTALVFTSAENGLLVFDSDEQKFYYWHQSQWMPLKKGYERTLVGGPGIKVKDDTISAIPDGDGDSFNEIQDLQLNGGTLTMTGSTISVDLAPFLGLNTDEQTLNYDPASGILDITSGNEVTITPAGAASGDLSGSYPSPMIATSAGNNIVGAINNASTTGTINAGRLAPSVVLDSESPAASDITGTFSTGLTINNAAVTSAKIVDGGVSTNDLANLAVTTGKIADGAITNNKIANGTIAAGKIAPSATNGQVLTTVGATTVWANPPSGGGTQDLASTLQAGGDAKGQVAYNFKSITIGTSGTAGPGAFNVSGSHYVSFRDDISGTYPVEAADYILVNTLGKPATVVLPSAAENRGRILIVRSSGSSSTDGIIVDASKDLIDGFPQSEPLFMDTNFSNNTAYSITILSTGSTWITIDRAIAATKQKG